MEVAGFEIKGRRPIYVYCKTAKNLRGLARFGEVVFTSQKGNYACLYIDAGAQEEVLGKLKALNYVREVRLGMLSELAEDFSAAFEQTNEELKKTAD